MEKSKLNIKEKYFQDFGICIVLTKSYLKIETRSFDLREEEVVC